MPPLRLVRSFSSSSATTSRKKTSAMPEKRLRALVTLYHQSSTWVTPENLDAYIDRVFTPPKNSPNEVALLTNRLIERRKEDFESFLKVGKSAPKFGGLANHFSTNPSVFPYTSILDSHLVKPRKMEINATLFGHDVSLKPGVESVRDTLKKQQASTRGSSDDT